MQKGWQYRLAGVLMLGITLHASADDHERVRSLFLQGDIVSLAQIIEQLPDAENARVMEVELELEHGRYVYEIEYLGADGVVRESVFDAATGELLGTEVED